MGMTVGPYLGQRVDVLNGIEIFGFVLSTGGSIRTNY